MAKFSRKDYTKTSDREAFTLEVTDAKGKVKEIDFKDPNFWSLENLTNWLNGTGPSSDIWFFYRVGFGSDFDAFYAEWKDAAAREVSGLTEAILEHFKSDED